MPPQCRCVFCLAPVLICWYGRELGIICIVTVISVCDQHFIKQIYIHYNNHIFCAQWAWYTQCETKIGIDVGSHCNKLEILLGTLYVAHCFSFAPISPLSLSSVSYLILSVWNGFHFHPFHFLVLLTVISFSIFASFVFRLQSSRRSEVKIILYEVIPLDVLYMVTLSLKW